RLIASSNSVGAWTGRPAGFEPLRIRSTYSAARGKVSPRSTPYDTRPPSRAMKRNNITASCNTSLSRLGGGCSGTDQDQIDPAILWIGIARLGRTICPDRQASAAATLERICASNQGGGRQPRNEAGPSLNLKR